MKLSATFCSVLLGADIHAYTNHKTLTHDSLTTLCILQWCCFIEDFHPTFHYLKDVDNSIDDVLLCLPQLDHSFTEMEFIPPDVASDHCTDTFSIEFDNNIVLES